MIFRDNTKHFTMKQRLLQKYFETRDVIMTKGGKAIPDPTKNNADISK